MVVAYVRLWSSANTWGIFYLPIAHYPVYNSPMFGFNYSRNPTPMLALAGLGEPDASGGWRPVILREGMLVTVAGADGPLTYRIGRQAILYVDWQ